jgi:hypothetical protein
MTHCQSDPDFNAIFRWHFSRYAAAAGRQSFLAASETETNPGELLQFAEARFRSLIRGFEASFLDCCYVIPGFLPAARRAMRRGNSNTHDPMLAAFRRPGGRR